MSANDIILSPAFRRHVEAKAARIINLETREDATQEAYADVLAIAPSTLIDAHRLADNAIDRVRKREGAWESRTVEMTEDA